jgi:hypothetical protein
MLEVIEIIKKLKYLKKIHLNFNFMFENTSVHQLFVKHFTPILGSITISAGTYFVDNYFGSLKQFTGLKSLTLSDCHYGDAWFNELAQKSPGLSTLNLVRVYHNNLTKLSINYILNLWPNISYVLSTFRPLTSQFNLSNFKPFFKSMFKQEPLNRTVLETQNWSNDMVYSKGYKTLLLAREDGNNGILPDNIEHLFFINFTNRSDITSVAANLMALLWKNPNLRSLRINSRLVDSCFPTFRYKAVNNPNKVYLLGDLSSNWYYWGQNLKSTSDQMFTLYEYGPENRII